MEKTTYLKIGAIAAAFLLMGTFAAAQAAPRARNVKPREASSGQASGIQQRKDGAVVHSDYPRDNATSHARTGENPLYEGSGKSGTNPMYEPKDRMKAPSGAPSAQSAAPYKDPEDMTTRTRPGRLKFPNVAAPETAADASRKHIAGVKYQNRTAAGKEVK